MLDISIGSGILHSMMKNILTLLVLVALLGASIILAMNAPTLVDPKVACEQRGGVYRPVPPGKLLKTCYMDSNLK